MVHSVLVNRSKSSSEKSTGLSRVLCRLGDRQGSPAKKVRSGRVDDEDTAEGADEAVGVIEESCCSGAAVNPGTDSLSCIRPGLSAELVTANAGGE